MSGYAAERVLLETLADVAASAGVVVSYNGKSFDLPLIETRFLFNRMATPFAGIPHLDICGGPGSRRERRRAAG